MAVVLSTGRQRLGRELGVLMIIRNADVTSLATTSITSTNMLRNSNWGTTKFSDRQTVIYRPGAASAADYIRYAGDLTNSTGALAHTGANYADTTVGSEGIELWYDGVRPDLEIVDSLNRVCEFEFVSSHHLLSHGSRLDYGMESSTDSNWTNIGSPTTSDKVVTQTQITPYGPRSYNLVNANANEGTRSAALVVTQGGTVSAYAIGAATVGTMSAQLRDNTNTADIGTAVTASYRTPMLLSIRDQAVPATCKATSLSLVGTESTANINWNQVALYKHDDLLIQLPGFVTEAFMIQQIYQMRPRSQVASNVASAVDLEPHPLIEGEDYWIVVNHADVEPYKVRFKDASYYSNPIFVEYKRPVSDFTTFAADDTASVPVAVHNLMPRWKMDVLETVYNGAAAPKHPDWAFQYDLAKKQLVSAQSVRRETRIGEKKPRYAGVSRM